MWNVLILDAFSNLGSCTVDVFFSEMVGREAEMASVTPEMGSTVVARPRRAMRGAKGAKREVASLSEAIVMDCCRVERGIVGGRSEAGSRAKSR